MWSASILVTTATMGCRCKNDASDSSASAIRYLLEPKRALLPALLSRPPITKVGSSSASPKTLAKSEVVVVLPCVPATAMPCRKRINSANISARRTCGIKAALAATNSSLSARIAELTTITSAPSTFAAAWPINTVAPSSCKRLVLAFSARSEPLIS